ncbi:hypothetical protein AVEN_255394-1 [Araneus ventricosus]|uniref:Uncharacterized protein n=1 Tax=Araneus ventricosus TaxID=182803 RepID=A0A4Y2HTU7_ARAVE|nr:hypothetical protein AVEN_255394-1 [Araneus ventricosus]
MVGGQQAPAANLRWQAEFRILEFSAYRLTLLPLKYRISKPAVDSFNEPTLSLYGGEDGWWEKPKRSSHQKTTSASPQNLTLCLSIKKRQTSMINSMSIILLKPLHRLIFAVVSFGFSMGLNW